MGVSKFFKIVLPDGTTLESKFPRTTLEALRGKTLAVDASNIIYRNLTVVTDANRLTDSDGNITNNISSIFSQLIRFKQCGIKTIWVFDNPEPNTYKAKELARRKKIRQASTNPKAKITMTSRDVADTQRILTDMGVTYMVAPKDIESDHLAAALTQGDNPMADYVLSGDSDVLIFGGNLLRIFYDPKAKPTTCYQTITPEAVIEHLGISEIIAEREDLVDPDKIAEYARNEVVRLAVTLGNDFMDKTPGYTEGNIMKKYSASRLITTAAQDAIFDYISSDPIATGPKIVEGKEDPEAITEFLLSKGFSPERITPRINNYFADFTK